MNASSYINVGLSAHRGAMRGGSEGLIHGEMLTLFKEAGLPDPLPNPGSPRQRLQKSSSVEVDIERITDAEHELVVGDFVRRP